MDPSDPELGNVVIWRGGVWLVNISLKAALPLNSTYDAANSTVQFFDIKE